MDSLEKLAYTDDSQIKKATIYMKYEKKNPSVNITLKTLNKASL